MHLESLRDLLAGGNGFTPYAALVLLLYLTCYGLPIPEEITLITAGALAYERAMRFPAALVAAAVAILVADAQVYYIGRRFGRRVLQHRLMVKFVLTPEGLEKAQRRFAGNSMWAIFTVRFISGLRWPTYFTAGTLLTPAVKFISIDLVAAAIQITGYMLVGYFCGPQVEDMVTFIGKVDKWIATAVILMLVMVAAYVAYRLGRRRQKKIDAATAQPPSETPENAPAPACVQTDQPDQKTDGVQ